MATFEDFVIEIKKTETMQALFQNLEEGPARLLGGICKEYEATNRAVPDHHLNLMGYFGEAMLRALTSANLVTKERGEFSLYGYKPTERGLELYKGMLAEKKI
ncbi:MAG: hypothetical protein JW732_07375 [Dehalococcoidia bacterium]|nr:hypothetical protein [Dehalococcoidia bacterium]